MAFITIAHCSLVKCPIDTRIGDANKQEQTIVVPISQSYGKLLLCLHNVLHISCENTSQRYFFMINSWMLIIEPVMEMRIYAVIFL